MLIQGEVTIILHIVCETKYTWNITCSDDTPKDFYPYSINWSLLKQNTHNKTKQNKKRVNYQQCQWWSKICTCLFSTQESEMSLHKIIMHECTHNYNGLRCTQTMFTVMMSNLQTTNCLSYTKHNNPARKGNCHPNCIWIPIFKPHHIISYLAI